MSRVLINGQDVNMTDGFPQMNYDEWKALPRDLRPDFTVIKDRNYTSEPLDNSVSVTADGVKTYSQLLNELYALIDFSKVTRNTCVTTTWGTTAYKFEVETIGASNLVLTKSRTTNGNTYVETFSIANNSSSYITTTITNSGATSSDKSTTVVPSGYGITFTLYYNIVASGLGIDTVKSVVLYENLNCTANTNSYVANQSFTIPSGYELVAVTNVRITDIATKPVVLRSWRKESRNAITFYWSNFGSTAVAVNVVAELLLRQV